MSRPDTVRELCLEILEGGSLEAKMRSTRNAQGHFLEDSARGDSLIVDAPARVSELRMKGGVERLPGLSELDDDRARLTCVERFAHHELMAVELFAWALLAWPEAPEGLRRGWLAALEDEQRHLRLYLELMDGRGSGLGDTALSDYFWKHVQGIRDSPHGPLAFLSAIGLTLEQANLDFALVYAEAFERAGDVEGAEILHLIHREEQGHVRLAVEWLRKLGRREESELETYQRTVPFPLCAARAKGKRFDVESRRRAGLSEDFIEHVRLARPRGRLPRETMKRGAVLIPNLGAEEAKGESRRSRQRNRGEAARTIARTWLHLFGGAALLIDGEAEWPDALGARPGAPVFGWLEDGGGAVAWLPTEAAKDQCRGLEIELGGPSPEVVARVHEKGFARRVLEEQGLEEPCLVGLIHVLSAEDLSSAESEARVLSLAKALPDWTRDRYVLKPRLATSGRGRTRGGDPGEDWKVSAAFPRLIQRGGAILEPWLSRHVDLSVQLHVDAAAGVELLGTTRQILRTSGVGLGNRGIFTEEGPRSGTEHDERMVSTAIEVARAAAAEGFQGPCGTDAFVFEGPDGEPRLRPLVELNARFTTGTIAMGLLARARAAGKAASTGAWLLAWQEPGPGWPALPGVEVLRLGTEPRPPCLLLAQSEAELDSAELWLTSGGSTTP